MTDDSPDAEEAEWSALETSLRAQLQGADLPLWEYKAQAALYTQGHRGILDLDLDFPSQYLKEATEHCYVWKIDVADGTRVHAYATVGGGQFHLKWLEGPGDKSQTQPEHLAGSCAQDACQVCKAAHEVATLISSA